MLWLQTDLIRKENSEDMSIGCAISMVFERRPDLRSYLLLFFQNIDHLFPNQLKRKKENNFSLSNCKYRLNGLGHKVLQWYLCRMEGWFAADADTISLKCWDQVNFLLTLFLHCLLVGECLYSLWLLSSRDIWTVSRSHHSIHLKEQLVQKENLILSFLLPNGMCHLSSIALIT